MEKIRIDFMIKIFITFYEDLYDKHHHGSTSLLNIAVHTRGLWAKLYEI